MIWPAMTTTTRSWRHVIEESCQMSELARRPISMKPRLADRPISFGLILAIIGAGLNVFHLYGELQVIAHTRTGHPGLSTLHTVLVLAFLLCVVGLALRSRPGLIVSILSLTSVIFLYVGWYKTSYREWKLIWEFSPSPEFIPSHPLGLLGATWFDIAILFAVMVVLTWQIKLLIGTSRHRDRDD